jgi:hypothetical protein
MIRLFLDMMGVWLHFALNFFPVLQKVGDLHLIRNIEDIASGPDYPHFILTDPNI